MKSSRFLFGIIFLLNLSFAQSQTEVTVRDFETWSTVGASKKFENMLSLDLEQSLRLYSNSSMIDRYFTNLSATGTFNKYFSIGLGIRYIRDKSKSNNNYDNDIRYNGDLNFKHTANRFKFKYRLRFQAKNELGFSRSDGDFSTNTLRLKTEVKYNIRNWKFGPEVSGEIFRESGRYILSSFNKFRFTIGTKYKINDLMDFKPFYRFEREIGVAYPLSTNVVGFKFVFNL